MNRVVRGVIGVVAVLVALTSSAAAPPAAAPGSTGELAAGRCDRNCLEGLVDRYLEALVAHDASRLPLRHGARFTENGQTLRLDEGLWGTAEAVGDYRVHFSDPDSGTAGYFGSIRESGRMALLALRLKVVGRRILEIETLVSRSSGANDPFAAHYDSIAAEPIFNTALKASEQRPRPEMIAVANSYFEGLEQATAAVTPFEPTCKRRENGSVTAGNPDAPRPMAKLSCGGQFATGFSPFISEVRGRRFPLVDSERGLVLAFLSFDHSGKIKDVKMTDGSTLHVPPPFDAPYSFLMAEVFKVRNGKIAQVEAVLITTPYAMPSGWEQTQ
jgi:hypothetical protein